MTYHLICLLTYHWTINRTTQSTSLLYTHLENLLLSNAYLLQIMDVGLQKVPCISCYYPLSVFLYSINYYLVCSLPVHKICTLCGIYIYIYIYLVWFLSYWQRKTPMTVKSGSGWVEVIESYTSEFLMSHFLLVINCTRGRISYRLWDIAFNRSTIAMFWYPSCV